MCFSARILLATLLATTAVLAEESPPAGSGPPPLDPLPQNWSDMGGGGPLAMPGKCEMGIDSQKSTADSPVYSVRCTNQDLPSFGGGRYTMQSAQYRGKRIRVSASLMASGIEAVPNPQYSGAAGEAGLWLGVGSTRGGMRSDRMENRAIKGTIGWETRDFIVDVPDDNNRLMIGFWMQGKGQLWVRDFKVEEVPATVPVNFFWNDPQHPAGPDLALLTAAPTTTATPANNNFLPPPEKWAVVGGQSVALCDTGIDAQLLKAGQRNLSISCGVPETATLRQAFEAAPYWGKRVRFSGWVRAGTIQPPPGGGTGDAGLILTNTDTKSGVLHANVNDPGGWQYRELVLQVPRNSTWILIGLTLNGSGQVWGRDFKFEEVPADTPVTPFTIQ